MPKTERHSSKGHGHRRNRSAGETRGRDRKFTSEYGVGSARFSKLPRPKYAVPKFPCSP